MSSVFTKNLGELSKSNCQFCKRFQGFQERKDDLLKGWQQNALHTRTIDYGGPYFIQMHSLKYLFPSFFIVLFAPYLKNKNWIKSFAKDSKVVGGTKEIQKTLHTERFLLHTTNCILWHSSFSPFCTCLGNWISCFAKDRRDKRHFIQRGLYFIQLHSLL